MLFNAYEFIFLFWPIALILFFQISQFNNARLATLWLVVASCFFYAWWNPIYLLLLASSIGVNYSVGVGLSKAGIPSAYRRGLLGMGIFANLAALGYFKYANFFAANVNVLAGTDFNFGNIILPLGISFFTFQQIAYLVDAYAYKTQEYRFLDYCLFVSFFPQLIAGPIVHHKDVMEQFAKPSADQPNDENLAVGLTIFSMGLFKKVILADTIATFSTPIFNAAADGLTLTIWDSWIAALAYTLQLYFDFSGYSDMAIGIARTFGIKLPLNFNSPYKADSITDFWRRWHITLSHFLRDYLYIPLGGSRRGAGRRYLNLFMTMTLGGLWHGAGWTFVIWGSLHGLYLVTHRLWEQGCKRLGRTQLLSRWISVAVTFCAVIVSWVFFRAANLATALSILQSMAGLRGISLSTSLASKLSFLTPLGIRFEGLSSQNFVTGAALGWIFILLWVVWCLPNTQQWMGHYQPALHFEGAQTTTHSKVSPLRWRPSLLWSAACMALSLWTVLSIGKESEFIYFQF